ncbi:hypothetical protein [Puerhibacterium sp. TATVAM-FAB25]|uniref:hypothetical protein n=1 Tax=Puerhibacterium sp. TATVAM-FAB25 TaxID=3093699 RepID=UPI00397DE059
MTRAVDVPRAAAALVLAAAAAACSAPPGADPDEIDRWLEERLEPSAPLGAMSAPVGPADPAPDPASPAGISVAYEHPERIEGVRLSCFGDGTLDFTVEVATGTVDGAVTYDRARSVTYEDLRCGPEHEVALPVADATRVRVDGFGADRDGAWYAVVVGDATA